MVAKKLNLGGMRIEHGQLYPTVVDQLAQGRIARQDVEDRGRGRFQCPFDSKSWVS